jgi:hypothetical protein
MNWPHEFRYVPLALRLPRQDRQRRRAGAVRLHQLGPQVRERTFPLRVPFLVCLHSWLIIWSSSPSKSTPACADRFGAARPSRSSAAAAVPHHDGTLDLSGVLERLPVRPVDQFPGRRRLVPLQPVHDPGRPRVISLDRGVILPAVAPPQPLTAGRPGQTSSISRKAATSGPTFNASTARGAAPPIPAQTRW